MSWLSKTVKKASKAVSSGVNRATTIPGQGKSLFKGGDITKITPRKIFAGSGNLMGGMLNPLGVGGLGGGLGSKLLKVGGEKPKSNDPYAGIQSPSYTAETPTDTQNLWQQASDLYGPQREALKTAIANRGQDIFQANAEELNARGITPQAGLFKDVYSRNIAKVASDAELQEQQDVSNLALKLMTAKLQEKGMSLDAATAQAQLALDKELGKQAKEGKKKSALGSGLGAVAGGIIGGLTLGPAGALAGTSTGSSIGSSVAEGF